MVDYGYRSKCCKAPIRMGKKRVLKLGKEIRVWICCACKTKDVDIISKEEALRPESTKKWWEDEDDDNYDG